MELITEELERKIEEYPIHSQENQGENAVILFKLFNPYGMGTWYVLEGDKQPDGDYLFFGYVESLINEEFNEYGYFSLEELENLRIPVKINGKLAFYGQIERDIGFENIRVGRILK